MFDDVAPTNLSPFEIKIRSGAAAAALVDVGCGASVQHHSRRWVVFPRDLLRRHVVGGCTVDRRARGAI